MTPAEGIWLTQQEITGLEEVDDNGSRSFQIVTDSEGYAVRPNLTEQEKKDMFAATFASEYNSYQLAGEVPGADDGTEDPSIIETFFQNIGISDPTAFGQMFADYWATTKLNPGDPQVLDVVIDVQSDAAALAPDFTAAVESSITTQLGTPPYYNVLIENVEAVAKTIKWTITEQNTSTGATTTYVSNIS